MRDKLNCTVTIDDINVEIGYKIDLLSTHAHYAELVVGRAELSYFKKLQQ